MLIYRQRKLNPVIEDGEEKPRVPEMPQYLHDTVDKVNKGAQADRDAWEDREN